MDRRFALSFLSSLALAAHAQISFENRALAPPSGTKRSITGSVANAVTGEPIRKVLVSLQTGEGQLAAFSDAAGHFTIDAVPEGAYSVEVRKPGFFQPKDQTNPSILINSATAPLSLKLVPGGSISGRVLDEDGEPMENALVALESTDVVNGKRRWQPAQSANTDEDGAYEMDGLQEGVYRLRLHMRRASDFDPRQVNRVYPQLFYPSGEDAGSALPIQLGPGQNAAADFVWKSISGFRVSGRVLPAIPGTFLRVQDQSRHDTGLATPADIRTGTWTIPAVPPGSWHLAAMAIEGQGRFEANQDIEVTSDVSNVALQLQPLASIPVKLLDIPEGAQFQMQTLLTPETGGDDIAVWSPHGDDAFRSVSPGRYRVRATVNPYSNSPLCVDDIRSGGVDLAREGLLVGPESSAPIEISVRTDCAGLDIQANGAEPNQPIYFLVFPQEPGSEVRSVGGNPTATIQNLTPGEYKVYAFDGIQDLEYMNPDVMKAFSGTEVSLDPNAKRSIQVDLVRRKRDETPK